MLQSHTQANHYDKSTPPFSSTHPPKIKSWKTSLAMGVVTSIIALVSLPVQALQVRLTPESPQLGDTISVYMETETSGLEPTVSMGGKNYPAFPIRDNLYRTLLPTTPLNQPGRLVVKVSGDGEVKNLAIWLRNRSFPTQRIRLSGRGGSKATQLELDRVGAFKKLVTPEKFWNGAFLRPNGARVSSIFGVRRYYNGVFAQNYYHRGVDYAGGWGSPVIAPASGKIALTGTESGGFRVHGNTVGIDHGQGVLSIFLHLSRIYVREGDFVQAGQRIGTIGSTGASTGPHLHWGLYVNGAAVDPVPWRFGGVE